MKKKLTKILLVSIILINLMALGFASGPNFANLGNSSKTIGNAKQQGTSLFVSLVSILEMALATATAIAFALMGMTKDEEKALKYKKWAIRALLSTVALGLYLGYLYQ